MGTKLNKNIGSSDAPLLYNCHEMYPGSDHQIIWGGTLSVGTNHNEEGSSPFLMIAIAIVGGYL